MRGNVLDLILISVILIIAGTVIMLVYLISSEIYETEPFASNELIQNSWEVQEQTLSIFANSFIIIFICFGLASAISSFFTETHPVFFIFTILMLGISVLIIALLSDVFVELASSGLLLPVAAEFVLMVETIANLKIMSVIMGVVIIVALFAKRGDVRLGGGEA